MTTLRAEARARWPSAVAGLFVVGMGVLALLAPGPYHAAVQEDGVIEWLTVGLFAAAGVVRLRSAWRGRRPFDGLVALFCLFVAGEEISWGQRLIGFTPPESFLAGNEQQEANLHNFAELFGRPGLTLALLLIGFGALLPLAHWLVRSRFRSARRFAAPLRRLGATPPDPDAVPWLLLCALLLIVYPIEFTGEWVEALAGGLFLAAARPVRPRFAPWLVALVLAALMTPVSAWARDPGGERTACVYVEAESLLRDLVGGNAALPPLATVGYAHKRLRSAVDDGYVRPDQAHLWATAPPCERETPEEAMRRRGYGIDPWGMSYWVVSDGRTGGRRVAIYSMGPNRRRDGEAGVEAGDDVVVYTWVQPPPSDSLSS